ncbi:MAG: mechanosensitive ion channel protein [Chloroflexi bacterium]|nr:MAG: mechanosensitive ion channel protein [Chloroflexota bacterium]
MDTITIPWDKWAEVVMDYGLKIIIAIIILVIGRWLARYVKKYTLKALAQANVDTALERFIGNLVYYVVLVLAVAVILNMLGMMTSLLAVFGAAALAVGLALEGSLANFAAGVLLLLFRPFKIGDLVEISGYFGTVQEILVFNTIMVTPDNKTVTISNSQVTGSPIVNYTQKGTLRLDMVFGIGYDDDLAKAKGILEEIVNAQEKVLPEPAPMVAVSELADSSVNFAVRPYVKPADYWAVYFAVTEQVKLRFDQEGISIPYPQQDVHLMQISAN